MRTYSKDLRLKVLFAVDGGMPRKEVVEVLDVSLVTIKRWLKRPQDAKVLFIQCGYESEA
ncbi:MAG TPA: helix-turn-helix domain-containing protein [Rubrobacteraceae bacterium]|nr:helix-turn-helix domain-containing protein [Rubrobacteraceae bacterium]